jgi:hypothetical protein
MRCSHRRPPIGTNGTGVNCVRLRLTCNCAEIRTAIKRLPSNKEGKPYKAFAERRLQAPSREISPSVVPKPFIFAVRIGAQSVRSCPRCAIPTTGSRFLVHLRFRSCRIDKRMTGLRSNWRKFAATLLLCVLTIASVAAPVCPACSKIELASAQHVAFNGTNHGSTPSCDKDGCSCCGFQIVVGPVVPSLELTASASALGLPAVLLLPGTAFDLYRPPRR